MRSSFSKLGIAATSFGGALYGQRTGAVSAEASDAAEEAKRRASATVPVIPGAPGSRHADTLEFMERCHALGASGVQTHMNGDLAKVRARAEDLGMWTEAMTSVRNSTPEQFEQAIIDAKMAGCHVARDAMLSGRRYESFNSLEEWNAWIQESHAILRWAIPILERHRFTLALENHKDWTIDEYVELFERYSCEYLGACLDLGNNISLLDDLMEVVERSAPYVNSTHIKDMAVMPCAEGFEMAEVPLGTGILDLPSIVSTLTKANPDVNFSLEMITRDPLKVACLSDHYWITFPDRNGIYLARTLRFVEENKSAYGLPTMGDLAAAERAQLETENIRDCIDYWERTSKSARQP